MIRSRMKRLQVQHHVWQLYYYVVEQVKNSRLLARTLLAIARVDTCCWDGTITHYVAPREGEELLDEE